MNCTLAGDAPCIYSYIGERERTALKLNEGKIRDLVTLIVKPHLAGMSPSGPMRVQRVASECDVFQPLRSRDGRQMDLDFQVGPGETGPHATTVVLGLVLSAVASTWPADKPFPHGNDRARFWAESVDRMLPVLKRTGITSMVRGLPPREKVMTWEEFRDMMLARGQKAAQ